MNEERASVLEGIVGGSCNLLVEEKAQLLSSVW